MHRRRVTLGYAGCRWQSRMTVSRPELPRSRCAGRGAEGSSPHRTFEGSPFVAPSTRCLHSLRSILCSSGSRRHEPPDEAAEFAGNGGDRDLGALALADEASVAAVEPDLRLARVLGDAGRLVAERLACPGPEGGSMAVAPTRLDEDAAGVAVAGLGDPASPLLAAAGVLAGDEADEGHELARALEATEVVDLGEEDHGGEGGDAPQAGELADRIGVGLSGRETSDVLLEQSALFDEVLDLEDVVLEGDPLRVAFELLASQPLPVALGPVVAVAEDAAMADEELREPMARWGEVLADILARADEIADRLLVGGRNGDHGELAGAIQASELPGVAAVGLHAVRRLHGDEGRGHDLAGDPHLRQLPIDLVPTGPRLVAAAKLVRLQGEPAEGASDDL